MTPEPSAAATARPDPAAALAPIGPRIYGVVDVLRLDRIAGWAIDRTDKFLDEAAMQDVRTVRVIHGHGTGRLRQALSGYLNAHPLVLRAAPAPNDMGGGAVTLVELKD